MTDSGSLFIQNWATSTKPTVSCTFSITCSTDKFPNDYVAADNNKFYTRYLGSPDFNNYCTDPCHFTALSLTSPLFTVNQNSGTKNINSQTVKYSSLFSLPGTSCTSFSGWSCTIADASTIYTDSIATVSNPTVALATSTLTLKIDTSKPQTLSNLVIACFPPTSPYRTFSDTFSI